MEWEWCVTATVARIERRGRAFRSAHVLYDAYAAVGTDASTSRRSERHGRSRLDEPGSYVIYFTACRYQARRAQDDKSAWPITSRGPTATWQSVWGTARQTTAAAPGARV